jgi:hypothetical protein
MTHRQMMSSVMMHLRNGREDYQESHDWFGEVLEYFWESVQNMEFVCEKYHVCMLSTNVNQYLAFRPPQQTWWVYECGAQVRKQKYGESPHLTKPLSSNRSLNYAIEYNYI